MRLHSAVAALFVLLICVASLAGAQDATDPYMGSGMAMPPPPGQSNVYDRNLFSSFHLGTTTKSDVVAALGKPGAWNSDKDGNSLLVYMYKLNSPEDAAQGVTQIVGVRLRFDAKKVLTKIELPNN